MKRHVNEAELAKKSMRLFEELEKGAELKIDYQQERECLIFNILLFKLKQTDLDYDYNNGMENDTENAVRRVVSNKPHLFASSGDACSSQRCTYESFSKDAPYYSYARREMYRASGDVYVCKTHGRDHLCTYQQCTQRMNTENRDDVRCRLTGKIYGPDISNMMSDQPFDTDSNVTTSNNPMTTTVHMSSSTVVTGSFSTSSSGNSKRGRRKKPTTIQILKDTSVNAPSIAQTILKNSNNTFEVEQRQTKKSMPAVFLTAEETSLSVLPIDLSMRRNAAAPKHKVSQLSTYKELLWERAKCLHLEGATPHALERLFGHSNLYGSCERLCRDILDDREIKANCIQKLFDAEKAAERKTNEYLRACTTFNDMPSFTRVVAIYVEELEPHLRKLRDLGAFEKHEKWYERTPEQDVQYFAQCMVVVWLMIHATPHGSKNQVPIDICKAGIFYTLHDGLRVNARKRLRDGMIVPDTQKMKPQSSGKLSSLASVVSRSYNIPPAVAVLQQQQHKPAAATKSETDVNDEYQNVVIEFIPKMQLLKYAPEPSDVGKSHTKDQSIQNVVSSRRHITLCFGSLFDQEHPIEYFRPYFLKNHTSIRI